MLIQLTNHKAIKLIHELEELELIKVLEENITVKGKLSEKYAGKLPTGVADELQSYVSQGREEWNGNI